MKITRRQVRRIIQEAMDQESKDPKDLEAHYAITDLLREYVKEMLSEAFAIRRIPKTRRFIDIGDNSVVLPADIQGDQPLDITNPSNSRERRAAIVLQRFRDGIAANNSKGFGSIGEDLVAAVLGGQQTNTYWDQNSLFSDVLVGETYYSVKASKNPTKLSDQGIGLPKIEKLLEQKGGQSISVGIAMISAEGDNLNISWTSPITLTKEGFDKIKETKTTKPGKPKWLYEADAGMVMSNFKKLMTFAGTGAEATTTTKTITLPPTTDGDDYDLGTNEIRDKFKQTFNAFRSAPDLTKEQENRLIAMLNQIQDIWS